MFLSKSSFRLARGRVSTNLSSFGRRHMCEQKSFPKQARGPVTFLSLGLTAVVGGALLSYYNMEKERSTKKVASTVTVTGKAALGGPWVLVDQDGKNVTDATYKGQYTLLYFGFSYCPDICPSELVKIGNIVDLLEKKGGKLKPVFISVDPHRDTVGQLKSYAADFHKSIDYLTGTKDMIAKATKAYRVYFTKANEQEDDEEDYLVDHSIVLYLVSPEGEFLEFFTQRALINDIVDKIIYHQKNDGNFQSGNSKK